MSSIYIVPRIPGILKKTVCRPCAAFHSIPARLDQFRRGPHPPWPPRAPGLTVVVLASAIRLARVMELVVRRPIRDFCQDANPKPYLIVLDVQHLDVSAEISANDQEPLSFPAVQYEHGVLLSEKAADWDKGACRDGCLRKRASRTKSAT